MGNQEQTGDRPPGVNTWVVIPYFADDMGRKGVERPLPPGKGASWLCPSIYVDGVAGGTNFRRGVPLRIAVEVANWGAGGLPAPALVRLWWCDPTLAFSSAVAIGETTVVTRPGEGAARTGDFRVTIPLGASPHVCLLAQVSAPFDGASGVPNPYSDRHWAQLNLVEVTSISGDGSAVVPVQLANPFPHDTTVVVTVEPMAREAADHLGRLYAHDIHTDIGGVEVVVGDGAPRIELAAGEVVTVDATLHLSDPPVPGAIHGVVLSQHFPEVEGEATPIGMLGVLVAPE